MSKKGIDTNVLIYSLDKESDSNQLALNVLAKLKESRIGVLCWQNLTEFYAIITDKRRVKTPLTSQMAVSEIDILLDKYSLEIIGPNNRTKELWFKMLKTHNTKGQMVHDMFLAATLLSNGINTLITANTKDFAEVRGLKVQDLVS